MATGTIATTARQFHQQMVHYLRKTVTFSDGTTAVEVGTVPAGSVLVGPISGAEIDTVFVSTGSTTAVNLDIGTTANDDLYATDLSTTSAGFKAFDEVVSRRVTVDTKIIATLGGSTASITAGEAEVLVAYIPDNDG